MEPTTSRRIVRSPGREPPGRSLFPRRRSSLLWFLPAVLVHLLVLVTLVTISRREAPPTRPLPRWALLLAAAEIDEPFYLVLPPPPGALAVPPLARPSERAPAPQPSTEPVPAPVVTAETPAVPTSGGAAVTPP